MQVSAPTTLNVLSNVKEQDELAFESIEWVKEFFCVYSGGCVPTVVNDPDKIRFGFLNLNFTLTVKVNHPTKQQGF